MKWYELLTHDESSLFPSIAKIDNEEDDSIIWTLSKGEYDERWNDNWEFHSDSEEDDGKAYDVLSNAFDLPIFSARLTKHVRTKLLHDNEVQFIPIKVFSSTGREIKGYSIANVLNPVPALDLVNSSLVEKVNKRSGEIEINPFGRVVLLRNALEGRCIVRLSKYLGPVFVSQEFVDIYHRLNCTGAEFVEVKVLPTNPEAKARPTSRRLPASGHVRKRSTSRVQLPDDLSAFLEGTEEKVLLTSKGRSRLEVSWIRFIDRSSARLSHFTIDTNEYYLNYRERGSDPELQYDIPGVDLIAECDGYSVKGILVYFPLLKEYGFWDCDHRLVCTFPRVGWKRIERNLAAYVNSQWDHELVHVKPVRPWRNKRCKSLVPKPSFHN